MKPTATCPYCKATFEVKPDLPPGAAQPTHATLPAHEHEGKRCVGSVRAVDVDAKTSPAPTSTDKKRR
jgi:hypothetical protein